MELLQRFRNVNYDYQTEDDSFVARGLQLNMIVDAINNIGNDIPSTGLELQDLRISDWLRVEEIREYTPDAGILIDGMRIKDGQVYTDQINELTTSAGVTIDGVVLKDGQMSLDYLGNPSADKSLSMTDNKLFLNWNGNFSSTDAMVEFVSTSASSQGALLKIQNVSAGIVPIQLYGVATPMTSLTTAVVGDLAPRFALDNAGKLAWGPGNTIADITLERTVPGALVITNTAGTVTFSNAGTDISYNGGTTTYQFAPAVFQVEINGRILNINGSTAAMTYNLGFEAQSLRATSNGADITGTLIVNTINEKTVTAGVTIEGVLLKDNEIVLGTDVTLSRTGSGTLLVEADRTTFTGTTAVTVIDFGHTNNSNYPWQWTVNGNTSLKLEHYLADYVTFTDGPALVTLNSNTVFEEDVTIEDLAGTGTRVLAADSTGKLVEAPAGGSGYPVTHKITYSGSYSGNQNVTLTTDCDVLFLDYTEEDGDYNVNMTAIETAAVDRIINVVAKMTANPYGGVLNLRIRSGSGTAIATNTVNSGGVVIYEYWTVRMSYEAATGLWTNLYEAVTNTPVT